MFVIDYSSIPVILKLINDYKISVLLAEMRAEAKIMWESKKAPRKVK